jgi:hypothetical protein
MQIHQQATDLVVKALQLDANHRIEFVHVVLQQSELKDAHRKKVQELIRKACEMRDKIAISLYNVELVDPRQLPLDFDQITPDDFGR